MKRLLLLTLLAGCQLTPEETTFQVLHAVDAGQTYQIARSSCYWESGSAEAVIGQHPSTGAAAAWGVGLALAHSKVSEWLEGTWAYWPWQTLTILHKAHVVQQNFQQGIGPFDHNCD